MGKNKFLMIGGGVIALAIIILVVLFSPREVNVITEKTEYNTGEVLKVKIENNLKEKICFSSCFPYYWEKKDGEGWRGYQYVNCPDSNLVETCVDPRRVKAFELTIPSVETGPHRIAIPACIGCSLKEVFKEDQWLYSNDFVVR